MYVSSSWWNIRPITDLWEELQTGKSGRSSHTHQKQWKKNDHDNGDKNGWHRPSCAGCWNSHFFYRQTVPRNHHRSFRADGVWLIVAKQNDKKASLHIRTGKHEHNVRLHEGTKIRCYFSLTILTNPALTQPENQSVTTLQGRLQAERRHGKLWLKGWVFAFRWR